MSKKSWNVVTVPTLPSAAAQHVLDNGVTEFDGVLLDAWTASVMVAVYGAINDENKAKLNALPIHKAATVCLKLANR